MLSTMRQPIKRIAPGLHVTVTCAGNGPELRYFHFQFQHRIPTMEVVQMSPDVLRGICKKHDLYRTPELNTTLYCNLKGFRSIANLEPYTGLVSLFLEGNAIASLNGLPCMPQLRCL